MRILVEGMDLTGKSTLCATLVALFQARGVGASHVVGSHHRGVLARAASRRYRATRSPGDTLQSWLFALASFADSIAAGDSRVIVQEAGVEHTLALAEAFDRPIPAAIARAAARLQPPADLAILLTAPRRVRLARLASRGHADPIDRLLLEDPVKAEIAELSLHAALRRRHPHLLVMDSSQLDPESILRRTISYLDHTQPPDQGRTLNI